MLNESLRTDIVEVIRIWLNDTGFVPIKKFVNPCERPLQLFDMLSLATNKLTPQTADIYIYCQLCVQKTR